MSKTKQEIEKVIEELEKILWDEQRSVERKITSDAPQFFRTDMKGCARGWAMATYKACSFLREKLLDK